MASEATQRLVEMAAAFRERFGTRVDSIWVFDRVDEAPDDSTINRIGGLPYGITDETWPRHEDMGELLVESEDLDSIDDFDGDTRMEHILTVDLRGLEVDAAPPGAVAAALFVTSAAGHLADDPETTESRVVFLTEDHLAHGVPDTTLPRRKEPLTPATYTLTAVDVPQDLFVFDPYDAESVSQEALNLPIVTTKKGNKRKPPSREHAERAIENGKLYAALQACAGYVGGEPLWIAGDPYAEPGEAEPVSSGYDDYGFDDDADDLTDEDGLLRGNQHFLLSFDGKLVPMRLGERGIMFVFGDSAATYS